LGVVRLKKDLTIRERLAIVETEVKNLQNDVRAMNSSLHEFKRFVYGRLEDLNEEISTLNNHLSKFDPGLSGRDKAAILAAFVTGLSSVIAVLLQVLLA